MFKCPICGKGEFEPGIVYDVSHFDCVKKIDALWAQDKSTLMDVLPQADAYEWALGEMQMALDRAAKAEGQLTEKQAALDSMETDRDLHWDEKDAALAEVERLRKGLQLVIGRNPGQAHRLARQVLTANDSTTCPDVDEYTCAECSGHNRCEVEMDAGFGTYEAPDKDR